MQPLLPYSGFYHPDYAGIHADLAAFLSWYEHHSSTTADTKGQARVGVFFARSLIHRRHTSGIDALIRQLENNGLVPVPVFSQQKEHAADDCPGFAVDLQQLSGCDVIVNCVSSFLLPTETEDRRKKSVLELIDAPVFQAVSCGMSEERWQASPQGLPAMNQVYWVAQPEFNGTIEPTVLFAKDPEAVQVEYGGPTLPVMERIDFFVRRIKHWLRLKNMPKAERRITILLHNNPCHGTEASLGGAAGLDSLESVVRLMRHLAEEGYNVEGIPENGAALTREFLTKKAINEFRWTTVEEIVNKGGVAAFIGPEQYAGYFDELSRINKEKMLAAWGKPPGLGMVHDGKLVVTGLDFGNIRVMAEPKRGCYGARCDGEVCKILHDPEVPPTHHCYGSFKWIQEHSDLIISTGTHGYIEFLPGKASGLSGDCFPQIITGEVPHLYIYTSKNPNEAILAKRRASAVVVDHLIPLMQSAGLYDELEEADALLGQYTNAVRMGDAARKGLIEKELRELVGLHKLLPSLDAPQLMSLSGEELVEAIHGKLFLLRDSTINQGLHVLSETHGIVPTARMILTILKFDGCVPSLRRLILELQGRDYDEVVRQSEAHWLLDECEQVALSLVEHVLKSDRIDLERVAGMFNYADPVLLERLLNLLEWIKTRLYPDLMQTGRELGQVAQAMETRYISPGPGGTLTRGKTDVLPTGRNIYSIDPRTIPTRAAHAIGVKLADEILAKSMDEDGGYPEKIGMVLWSLDAFRSDGEQLGQILHLMGVRPLWNESGVVVGVEPLPLAELGRPRIDVTIRTSEIFRDTLPNLMELLDRAVVMIAGLEEDEADNFILKNVNEYKTSISQKLDAPRGEDLERAATFRIFAAKPGTYGNGIKLMLAASAWKSVRDLGETFVEHGGFAYGNGVYGRQSHHEFVHNLKKITTVFHKMETDETDPLDCCYNDFQGGMTAAVRALSNVTPKVLWGDTRDPGNPRIRALREEIERVVRVKLLNPQWIQGMKHHGYKGAQDMAHKAASLYGWDATSDVVDDWIFNEVARKHALDKEMREFYQENNPWALEELTRRFLEAEQRGLWQADPEVLAELRMVYLEIEGTIEEHIGETTGEFQGGSIQVRTKAEVKEWAEKVRFDLDGSVRVR
nr:cobaltochelatase subunit CobN [uncultured Desulfobulbus sp.]